jgi:hypothetical protein
VNWIKSADLYIQNQWFNWKFLFANPGFSQACNPGNALLTAPANLGMWDLDTFRITIVGSTFPDPLPAFEYENVKTDTLDTTQDIPWRVIVMPDNSLKFEAVPNAAHIITADYFTTPIELAVNSDVSAIPVRFHRAILGRAIWLYGNYEKADEQIKQGNEIYGDVMPQLETYSLPTQNYSRRRTGGIFEVIGSQTGMTGNSGFRNGRF